MSHSKLWFFSFLALFTHMLLDAFTTYGTQLLLPFNDWRVSLDSINIIDPVYSTPLLIGLLFSMFYFKKDHKNRSLPNNIGIMLSTLYLVFTLANKQHIERVFYSSLEEQNIPSFNLLTVPVKIGNMEWYGVTKDKDQLYIGNYSMIKKNQIEFHAFPINNQLLDQVNPKLVSKMKWFAQGYYTVAEKDGKIRIYNMQCDMQGVREYGGYKAPTAFYFEIIPEENGDYKLSTGMHHIDIVK